MPGSAAIGYGCAAIAVAFFGSNFVVTKRYPTGDGLFFNWVMALAIWVAGLTHYIVLCETTHDDTGTATCPPFEPFAALGGAIWVTGNVCVVTIVKCIGLGLGLCVWGAASCLIGWACGRFGILGVEASALSNPTLNDVGICLAVASLITFLFIRSSVASGEDGGSGSGSSGGVDGAGKYARLGADDGFGAPLAGSLNGGSSAALKPVGPLVEDDTGSWVDSLSPAAKQIVGLTLSIASGICYGANFNPASFVSNRPDLFPQPGNTQRATHLYSYVFAHFCGILLAATFYMLLYAACRRNKPQLYPEIVLPGFASGVIWAIAQVGDAGEV